MLGSQVLCEKPLADIQTRETEPPQISRLVVDNWVDLERQPRGRDPSRLLALLWVRVNASLAAQGGGARSPSSCRAYLGEGCSEGNGTSFHRPDGGRCAGQ